MDQGELFRRLASPWPSVCSSVSNADGRRAMRPITSAPSAKAWRPCRKRRRRRKRGLHRPRGGDLRYSELVAGMRCESILRHQLLRDLLRQLRLYAAFDVDVGKLPTLGPDILRELFALACQIGLLGVGLRAHRHI